MRLGGVGVDDTCAGEVPIGPMFDEAVDIMYRANQLPLLSEDKQFADVTVRCLRDMNDRYGLRMDEAAALFLNISLATAYGYKPATCGPPPAGTSEALFCEGRYDYMENTPASVTTASGTRRIAERCDASSNLAYLSGAVVLYKKLTASGSGGFASIADDTIEAAMKILVTQAWGSVTFHAGGSATGTFSQSDADAAGVPYSRLWAPNTTDVFGYNDQTYTSAFPSAGGLGALGYTALSGRLFDTVPTSMMALLAWQTVALPLLEDGLIVCDVYYLRDCSAGAVYNATNLVQLIETMYTSPLSDTLSILQDVQSNVAGYREIFPAVVTSGVALLGNNTVTRSLLKELNSLLNPGNTGVYDDVILPILAVQDRLSPQRTVNESVAACIVAQGIPILALFVWAFAWQEETFKLWALTNSNLANLLGGLFEGVVSKFGVGFFDIPREDALVDELTRMGASMYPAIRWCRLAFGRDRAAHAKWHSASAIGLPALFLWVDKIKEAQALGEHATCDPTPGLWADLTDLIRLLVKVAA